mmetsp:Transcript_36274/g.53205  ORF Transcript_36274/g.53205 Transcript_36274/m.53205 type:complete len:201 (-) Transcript_36274:2395-2997(-)
MLFPLVRQRSHVGGGRFPEQRFPSQLQRRCFRRHTRPRIPMCRCRSVRGYQPLLHRYSEDCNCRRWGECLGQYQYSWQHSLPMTQLTSVRAEAAIHFRTTGRSACYYNRPPTYQSRLECLVLATDFQVRIVVTTTAMLHPGPLNLVVVFHRPESSNLGVVFHRPQSRDLTAASQRLGSDHPFVGWLLRVPHGRVCSQSGT